MIKRAKPKGRGGSSRVRERPSPARSRKHVILGAEREEAYKGREAVPITVVGIGASAGGLEAVSQLLKALPSVTGLALVIVQHLAPKHSSVLANLLGATTSMAVLQVEEGAVLLPNHVYVIPPNVLMTIHEGRLRLTPRPDDRAQFMPIDFFFRSLAQYAQSKAIGIILSGTASDGTVGMREIKAAGGITMAQDPKTARYDGMPRSAIATNAVDLIVSPKEMAAELTRLSRHPLVRHVRAKTTGEEFALTDDNFLKIVHLLKKATGVDFTLYKQPTIRRRVHRRMVLHKLSRLEEYIRYMQRNPDEAQKLFQDILIHVTRFFRDSDSFRTLQKEVFPVLLKSREGDEVLRVWVPGCSTGEEVYSVVMSLLEYLGDQAANVPIQVFGTDISEAAVEHARAGIYPESIAADVSEPRLRRYFTKIDNTYKINRVVRDLCVFARHDLTRDPTFSKLDLVLCRNVLIYLATVLQKRLLRLFNYALKPHGFLMLGSAETTGPNAELFLLRHKRWKLYSRKSVPLQAEMDFPLAGPASLRSLPVRKSSQNLLSESDVQSEANRVLLSRFAPPGVIVDEDLQIVQFRGQTGSYLEPAPGDPSSNLLKMVREGLLYGVRTSINEARRSGKPVRNGGLHVKVNGSVKDVAVEVIPVGSHHGHRPLFLVLFETEKDTELKAPAAVEVERISRKKGRKQRSTVLRLEEELAASREYLQSIIQDLEAANEELQSANEEILSANEELQSTNEELDTAKEELQSTNEELNTLNEELHGRNEELSRVNSDLLNLLSSVQIAIVMVASDLRIRRFTPVAEKMLNLIPGDVGRPISDIKPNFDCPDLADLISEAVDSMTVREREVRDSTGHTYSLRIRPYKNIENKIDGAVVAVFETSPVSPGDGAPVGRTAIEVFAELCPDAFLVLNERLEVVEVNQRFSERFGIKPSEARNRRLYELNEGQWDIPPLHELLETVLPRDGRCEGFLLGWESDGQRATLHIDGRQLTGGGQGGTLTLLTIRTHPPEEEKVPREGADAG